MARAPASTARFALEQFTTFGDLLRYVRRRAGLTQRELSIAVGYDHAHISRLEKNQRVPDPATLAARFAPALGIESEPELLRRLLELAARSPSARQSGPVEAVAPAPRHNLPRHLTHFIGRDDEIVEVRRLLAANRLVTLSGAGGCGKTRLAIQAAHDLVDSFPNGVWLVELAPLSNSEHVPNQVASVLDLREQPDRPLASTLASHLRDKSLLLVVDNCEHVVHACAQLVEGLLQACPGLRVLTTSREPLGLAGEHVRRVPSLSLPGAQPTPSLEDLMQSEAVQLFVDRAVTALPEFRLTGRNALAVAEICRRLDGLPLAIELAAAQVGLLRVEQIAARLDDRFRLLHSGSRTSLPRQQTLQASIAWSYDLLSEAERQLLARLAVFAGGWTLEAAEAVCADIGQPSVSGEDVLGLLTSLVSKSLVSAQRTPGQDTRFSLLETIREFARQRLMETGEADSMRREHASYLLGVAQAAQISLATQDAWLEPLVPEFENLRSALDWALEHEPKLAVRLVEALGAYWFHADGASLGQHYIWRALQLAENMDDDNLHAALLDHQVALYWQQGDYEAVLKRDSQLAERSRQSGDRLHLAWALFRMGMATAVLQGPQAGYPLLQQAIALSRELNDVAMLADYLTHTGSLLSALGDDPGARVLHEESAALSRKLGNIKSQGTPLGFLAHIALRQGEYDVARSLFTESLRMHKGWHKWGLAWRLEGFAALAVLEEEPDQAARLYGAAEALLASVGAKLHWIDRLSYDQYVATAREQLGEAAFAKAWVEGRAMTAEQAVRYALSQPASGLPSA
jgi:non-specific serine/threonine protein kinase